MKPVSTVRLFVLRATYLLLAVGLGLQIWPGILHHRLGIEHMHGVVLSLLGTVGLLSLFGLRYPLKMLPLLLFELTWKSIWLIAFGIPLWSAHAFNADTKDTWNTLIVSVILFVAVIPWGYVWRSYLRQPAEPWMSRSRASAPSETADSTV